MNLFWDYFEARTTKKDAKNFGNVIHPPIICDDIENNTPVIQLLPPPELHLLIGPVNTMDWRVFGLVVKNGFRYVM